MKTEPKQISGTSLKLKCIERDQEKISCAGNERAVTIIALVSGSI